MITDTVFAHMKFWLLVAFSIVLPFGIYGVMLLKRAISRATILIFGVTLVAVAGIDLYLLQSLTIDAKLTPSLADDAVFASEMTLGLYLLPVTFVGIGINILSHFILRRHDEVEKQIDKEHAET